MGFSSDAFKFSRELSSTLFSCTSWNDDVFFDASNVSKLSSLDVIDENRSKILILFSFNSTHNRLSFLSKSSCNCLSFLSNFSVNCTKKSKLAAYECSSVSYMLKKFVKRWIFKTIIIMIPLYSRQQQVTRHCFLHSTNK